MTKKLLLAFIALVGLANFTAYAQTGFTCNNPIVITALPYQTSDNTGNYGDTTDQSQPSSCAGTTMNYMTGNDVFYSYTPAVSGVLNIQMSPLAGWSGIFVYNGCTNVGVNCVAGAANSGMGMRSIPALSVAAGQTYIIAISTNAAPQTLGYTLSIQSLNCQNPTALNVSNVTSTSANLSWSNPGNTNGWQVVTQPSGSGVPSGSGTAISTSTYTAANLTPNTSYEYWVRSDCGDGTFSIWSGPYNFQTPIGNTLCPAASQCNYSFIMVDTYGDGWTGNTMTISQNGNFIASIGLNGTASSTAMESIPLCDGQPFELQWNTGGSFASEVAISIVNPFGQTIYTKPAGTGTQGSVLYTGTVNCATPLCLPPTNLNVSYVSDSSVNFSWTDTNGTQWEYVVLPTGTPAPTPAVAGSSATSNPQNVTGLTPGTAYTFYVRTVCASGSRSDWAGPVTFTPQCPPPTNLLVNLQTETTATLSWTETGTATQWEVAIVPVNSTVSPTTIGVLTATIPFIATGLAGATNYRFYVRSVCSSNVIGNWSAPVMFWQPVDNPPINDECQNAILAPVNSVAGCAQSLIGTSFGATYSPVPLPTMCSVSAERDVWYRFVATATDLQINVNRTNGSTAQISQALYSGDCGNLVPMGCGYNSLAASNLTIGATYFIRVLIGSDSTLGLNFNLCISTPPNCYASNSVCGVQNYANITGIPSFGQLGCLHTTPNATYFSVKIATSGSVKLIMTQSSLGSGTPNLDVDYAAWGPFPSQNEACDAITPLVPPLTGLTTGCSYSAAAVERFEIANAQAGDYYIILITNFSNDPGFINITVDPTSTGAIDCAGIKLNAFIDTNNNGTQESGEQNFPLGQFHYEINNNGSIHNIISPSGSYTIYDADLTNSYVLNHSVNADYSAMYSSNATYSNVIVSSGGLNTYYFPVTVSQDYTDLAVSVTPITAPRAGTTYKNKVVYTNYGTQPMSGTVTFDNPTATLVSTAQTGTVTTPTGFTYNFTDLQPFESRSIMVMLSVPAIPAVSIGQMLTSTASITLHPGDIIPANNNSTLAQAIVAAYDPNDKTETHGSKIQFSTFGANDYLQYTIRFENTGNTSATNISLVDMLDPQLDESSLVMVSASHNYTLDRVFRNLIWKFDEISLPVSVAGSDVGKGYVTFKIKLKPGFAIGDIIPNTASIYFDTNPAIVTNTFNTEFVTLLANATFDEGNVMLYPNPANGAVQVQLQNTGENLESIVLYDLVGKVITKLENISTAQSTIDISAFAQGIYLLEVTTGNNLKLVKKLVIK